MKAVRQSKRRRHDAVQSQQYTLQQDLKSKRTFIADQKWKNTAVLAKTQAGSWLQAKQNLGFPLSALQEVLLARRLGTYEALLQLARQTAEPRFETYNAI